MILVDDKLPSTLFKSCYQDKEGKEIDRISSINAMPFQSPIDVFMRLRKWRFQRSAQTQNNKILVSIKLESSPWACMMRDAQICHELFMMMKLTRLYNPLMEEAGKWWKARTLKLLIVFVRWRRVKSKVLTGSEGVTQCSALKTEKNITLHLSFFFQRNLLFATLWNDFWYCDKRREQCERWWGRFWSAYVTVEPLLRFLT